MNDKISGRALNALAALVHELRPDWQEPGILDALSKATTNPACYDGWHLALAAIRAASDLGNRTPRVIALDGRHWVERLREPERPVTRGTDCRFCDKCRGVIAPGETDHDCRVKIRNASGEARALARQAAADARGGYERATAGRRAT